MPDSAQDFPFLRQPTPERPLMGHTVLLVEDSRFASEALRLLCVHSGARIRRADTIVAARRHLRTYRPSVMIVDLGLPDGSGADLIKELHGGQSGISAVVAISGDPNNEAPAIAAGADAFLVKPIHSLAVFQTTVLNVLPAEVRPEGLRPVPDFDVAPDRLDLVDDLEQAQALLNRAPDPASFGYAASFLVGIARSNRDAALEAAARKVESACARGLPAECEVIALRNLISERTGTRSVVTG